MSRFVDAIITYRILRILTTPFDQTDAYRLGIIDARGRVLKKDTELNTVQERDSYTLLHRMIYRLKRIIEKVPIESKRIVSFAAALSLIKENIDAQYEPLPSAWEHRLLMLGEEHEYYTEIAEVENFLAGHSPEGSRLRSFKMHLEDGAVANSVGTGFTNSANPNGNPNLTGPDKLLGRKIQRRKKL
jgi:hypothetical protein